MPVDNESFFCSKACAVLDALNSLTGSAPPPPTHDVSTFKTPPFNFPAWKSHYRRVIAYRSSQEQDGEATTSVMPIRDNSDDTSSTTSHQSHDIQGYSIHQHCDECIDGTYDACLPRHARVSEQFDLEILKRDGVMCQDDEDEPWDPSKLYDSTVITVSGKNPAHYRHHVELKEMAKSKRGEPTITRHRLLPKIAQVPSSMRSRATPLYKGFNRLLDRSVLGVGFLFS